MLKRLRQAADGLRKRIVGDDDNTADDTDSVIVVPRAGHTISRRDISDNALKVMQRLIGGGFEAYLVGGGVRDLLLDGHPKDFDIATDARPEEVRALFRNSRIIGRRFKIVHVIFGREVIEVTTFRGGQSGADDDDDTTTDGEMARSANGMLLRDNVYGTVAEDAARRDFTINALYYALSDFSLRDFCGGLHDIEQRRVRIIGDAETRYREDPVRMLRAVRFAAKLDFAIADDTAEPLARLAHLLHDVAPARLFDEVLKLFLGGGAEQTFYYLEQYGLLGPLFPATTRELNDESQQLRSFIVRALENTDKRVRADKPVTPAFLYAALLWPALVAHVRADQKQGQPPTQALQHSMSEVLAHQVRHVSIPRRFSTPMREIWDLQGRLERRPGRRVYTLLEHPRFRAAYDFLLLREESGEDVGGAGSWWTDFQEADEQRRAALVDALKPPRSARKRRRRPRRQPPSEP